MKSGWQDLLLFCRMGRRTFSPVFVCRQCTADSMKAEQIGRPQLRSRQLTKCDEHRVTGRMPEFVVDAFEAIEIERKKATG